MTAKNTTVIYGDYQSGWGVSKRCCEGAYNNSMQRTVLRAAADAEPSLKSDVATAARLDWISFHEA